MKISFETNNSALIETVQTFVSEWNNNSNSIFVQTSGSTGQPKTIEIEKKHMIASAKMTGDYLQLKPGMTALLSLSPSTIAGKMMIVRSFVLEMNLIVTEATARPLQEVNTPIDFAALVPYQVQHSIDDLDKIGKLIIGGGAISTDLWRRITESNVEAYQTFGMTETISHIAMRKIEIPESAYVPLKGVDIETESDCLVVHAPHLGVDHLKTNDVVTINESGSFFWVGRSDFVINSGGIKIHPEQIEKQLSTSIPHPFFSFGVKDDVLGEKHIICIEGATDVNRKEMIRLLPKYHIPKEVYFFDNFEYTNSGKINRAQTIERLANAKKQVL